MQLAAVARRLEAHVAAPLALLLVSAAALAQAPARRPAPPSYQATVRTWHTPSPDARPPVDDAGHPVLILRAINGGEHASLTATGPLGGFSASDLDLAAAVMRDPGTASRYPVEPRLLDLALRIQTHFGAEEVRVLSGYRRPARGGRSNHGKGRAIDLIIPGTPDGDVAAFARTLGFVGVGIYPVSGFVHVDVRDRSYFWSDSSGPGKKNRERGILGDLARASDRDAMTRGEHPTRPATIGFDVDAALRSLAPREPEAEDEDDPSD